MFKTFPHKKDEALSLDIDYLQNFPIPSKDKLSSRSIDKVSVCIESLADLTGQVRRSEAAFAEWLRLTFDLEKLPTTLHRLSEKVETDAISAILTAFPKHVRLGAADIGRIRKEVRDTILPVHQDWLETQSLERELSGLVNEAYGLTEDDVSLMWRTAPPRMPIVVEP